MTASTREEKTSSTIQSIERQATSTKKTGTPSHSPPSKQALHRLAAGLNDFGALYHRSGIFDKALLKYQDAVHIRMKALKIDSGDAAALAELSDAAIQSRYETTMAEREETAQALSEQGKYNASTICLDLYQRSESRIACDQRNIMVLKPITAGSYTNGVDGINKDSKYLESAVTLYNMGLVHQESNNLDKATQLFGMALRVVPRLSFPTFTALILYSSAQAFYEDGEHGRAARDLSEAIQLYSTASASGVTHSGDNMELGFAAAIALLGRIHFDAKDFNRAVELCQEVLRIRRSVLGDNHLETAVSFYNLGLVLGESGRDEFAQEAIRLVAFSLQVFKSYSQQSSNRSVVTTSHIVAVLRSLGSLYHEANSFVNAVQCITKALDLARSAANEHPSELTKLVDVADALYALGRISHEQGQHHVALEQYHEALRFETMLGEEHEEMASVLCSIGQVHHELGDLELALEYQERVLTLSRRLLGDNSAFVADLLTILGNLQNERGNTEEAMARFAESERIMLRIRQANEATTTPMSLVSLSGVDEDSPAVVTNLLQSFGIEFHPAAAAA